jgi:hypothetical protein
VKNHLPALKLRQAGEWTRIHTNEGEGIGTPVSDPARYELENLPGLAGSRSACHLQTVFSMGRLKAGHPTGVFKTRS